MGISPIDYAIVIVYLAGVTAAGVLIAGRQKDSREYFLGGKQMSWWSVGFSIVASETSTLTFISIPGLAFRSDMHFLQLVFGYFTGRILVSLLFIPAYYRGDLETAYDFLGKRFGLPLRRFTSSSLLMWITPGIRLSVALLRYWRVISPRDRSLRRVYPDREGMRHDSAT
jgi:Na+/proline symporter